MLLFVAGAPGAARNCPPICPLIYAPVCGTNRRTYSNSCELNIAICKGVDVQKARNGPCRGYFSDPEETPETPEQWASDPIKDSTFHGQPSEIYQDMLYYKSFSHFVFFFIFSFSLQIWILKQIFYDLMTVVFYVMNLNAWCSWVKYGFVCLLSQYSADAAGIGIRLLYIWCM